MAICASCGAASAEGALGCASCGRPLSPPSAVPPYPPPPPSVPPVPPPPPPSAPPAGAVSGPGTTGSWGAGRPYDPATGRSAVFVRVAGADWRPALRVVLAPTAVLLLAALVVASPETFFPYTVVADPPSYGTRFGTALVIVLGALGAPFHLDVDGGGTGAGAVLGGGGGTLVRAVPMTITVLWLLALWAGLRIGARRRQERTGEQQTRRQAAGEAVRVAVAAAAVTLLLGLAGGAAWHPGRGGFGLGDPDAPRGFGRVAYESSAGWLQAAGWTALLAGLLAFAVHGTDALRWAAWRNRAVRGWAVAGLAAGRALAVSAGLSAVVALVLVAFRSGEEQLGGELTGAATAFLPNVGLMLLGLGSGATFRIRTERPAARASDWLGNPRDVDEYSFFDLDGASGDWRWTGLLALVCVAVLGWTAYRRRLDLADRIRLAVVHTVVLSLLMTVSGLLISATSVVRYLGENRDIGYETEVSLVPWTLLAANALWAAAGALALPPLLAARDRREPPVAEVPAQEPTDDGPFAGPVAAGMPPSGPGTAAVEVIGSGDGRRGTGWRPGDDGPEDPGVWSRRP
ncbi:hypothetical protein ACFCX4_25830 [Kitasatospora sp. NPDC056327]|uniref:hypothetical protein n=1 Tax=Kitasatospora sp. NPDC056327 TaxID=3345785 RepID=UPI0035DB9E5A